MPRKQPPAPVSQGRGPNHRAEPHGAKNHPHRQAEPEKKADEKPAAVPLVYMVIKVEPLAAPQVAAPKPPAARPLVELDDAGKNDRPKPQGRAGRHRR